MAVQRPDRPQFFEGQFLGSSDLSATIAYARAATREHVLAGHTWGIAIGLDLVETSDGSGNTLLFIAPGFAWDGYGRPVAVLTPVQVPPELFANLASGPAPVWLRYDQQPYSGLRPGFQACNAQDSYSRLRESFAIEAGPRAAISDRQGGVSISGVQVDDARLALRSVDRSGPLLCDASIPYQLYPDDSAKWLIPIGLALWQAGAPGSFQPRSPDLKKQSRATRRYAGAVAEGVYAADGVLRLRDRHTDYQTGVDVDTQCAADAITAADLTADAAGRIVGSDLVWVEGDMRAKGQVRLWGTRLELRDDTGNEVQVPLYARRGVSANNPAKGQDFQIVIGEQPDGNNRLAIGTAAGYGPIAELLVVRSDGKLGIGTNTPDQFAAGANNLVVQSPGATGISIVSNAAATGTLSFVSAANDKLGGSLAYDHGAGSLAFSAGGQPYLYLTSAGALGLGTAAPDRHFTIADSAGTYLNVKADGGQHEVLLGADGGGGIVSTITNHDLQLRAGANSTKVTIKASGDVGIGTPTPALKLDIQGDFGRNNGPATVNLFGSQIGDIGGGILFLRSGGTTVAFDGGDNVGIGTAAPALKLDIQGDFGRNNGPATLNLFGSQIGDIGGGILFLRSGGTVVAFDGGDNVGIATATPQAPLDVNGNARKNTGLFWSVVSDARLKKNIAPVADALDRLLQLRGVSFEWNEPEKMAGRTGQQLGLVAQEVEEVFPEWVETGPDGTKSLNLQGFEALLIEALRRLSTDIGAINERLARLESRAPPVPPG
jgi:Chaperone of endosialidase